MENAILCVMKSAILGIWESVSCLIHAMMFESFVTQADRVEIELNAVK
jgi:hypothetical protein